jgi:hypothetical protein
MRDALEENGAGADHRRIDRASAIDAGCKTGVYEAGTWPAGRRVHIGFPEFRG